MKKFKITVREHSNPSDLRETKKTFELVVELSRRPSISFLKGLQKQYPSVDFSQYTFITPLS